MLSQCPQCKTVFRVRPEQLEAANGKVRCSRCHTVFIAAEHPYRTKVEPAQQTNPINRPAEPSPRTSANDRLRSSHPFSWPEVRQKSQPVPSSTPTPAPPPPAEPGPQHLERGTEELAQPPGSSTPPEKPTQTPTEQETQAGGSLPQELQSELSALFPDSAQAHTPSPTEPEPPASLTQPQDEGSTDDAAWLKYLQVPAEDNLRLGGDDETNAATGEAPVEEESVAQEEEDEANAPWMKYIYGQYDTESDLPTEDDDGIQSDTSEPTSDTGAPAAEEHADDPDDQEETRSELAVENDIDSAFSIDDEKETWWAPPHAEGTTEHNEEEPATWFDDSDGAFATSGGIHEHEFIAEAEDAGPETPEWTLSDEIGTEPGSDDEDPPFTIPLDDQAIQDDELELPLDSGDAEQATQPKATVYDLFGSEGDANSPPLGETVPEEPEQAQEVDLWSDFGLEDQAEPEPDAHLDLFTDEDEPSFAAEETGEGEQQTDIELWSDTVLDEELAQEAAPHHDLYAEEDESPIAEPETETPAQEQDADLWDDLHFEEEAEQQPAPPADQFDTGGDSPFGETLREETGPADEGELWVKLEDKQDSAQRHPDLFAAEHDAPVNEQDSDTNDELWPESDEDSLFESYTDLFAESEELSDEQYPEEPAENERESWFDSEHEPPASGDAPGTERHEEAATGSLTGAGRPAEDDSQAYFANEGAPDAPALEPEPALATAPGSTGKPFREGYNLPPQLAQTASHNNRATLGWGLGILLLLSTLGLQYLYYQRAALAQSDTWRPLLEQMCAITGCELPLRRDLSQVQLVEHLMQNHPRHPDSLLITATLINRADFTQPFPLVEVVMTDLQQKVVARRRFLPEHYLVGDAAQQRFVPNTRIPLLLEVVDPGESAVGFEFHFY